MAKLTKEEEVQNLLAVTPEQDRQANELATELNDAIMEAGLPNRVVSYVLAVVSCEVAKDNQPLYVKHGKAE